MKRFPISILTLAVLIGAYGAEQADAGNITYTFTTLDDPSAPSNYYPNGGTEAYQLYGNTVVGAYFSSNIARIETA